MKITCTTPDTTHEHIPNQTTFRWQGFTFGEYLSIPGIGPKIAGKIWELRDDRGALANEDLSQIQYFRLTPATQEVMYFSHVPDTREA